VIGGHQSFTNRMNILKTLADAMENATVFEDINGHKFLEYVQNSQKFVPLRIQADASVEDTEKVKIMTRYGEEVLKTIQGDADKYKTSISRNLDVATRILVCKREYLEETTSISNKLKRQISRENGFLVAERNRKNRLQKEDRSLASSRIDFEIARHSTSFCLPCVIGFKIKLKVIDKKRRSLRKRISHSQTTISLRQQQIKAYQRDLDSLPSEYEMKKLKNDIYELDGLKNSYSTTIDNLKALKQVTKNIEANAQNASAMIEDCGNNIDDCYTIVPIRTALAKLKREGKTFWDYLQLNH